MNLQPAFDFWMSTIGVAAVGAALLMGLAGGVAMRCRSGRVQRAVWLGAFAATGLFQPVLRVRCGTADESVGFAAFPGTAYTEREG